MAKFRFQDLEIWQLAIEIADKLFDIADELEKKHLYRWAEQLRACGMSMSKSIEHRAKRMAFLNALVFALCYALCAKRHAL